VCVYLVGSPLEVSQVINPTEEEINKVHQQYVERLVSLFEAHKLNYGIPQQQRLTII